MLNKRGQEGGGGTSLGMIISIVLLVLILIFAAYALTSSGREFLAKVFNFKGGTTLDSVVSGCALSADSQATDSFCSELKYVNLDGKDQYVTCDYLRSINKLDKSLVCLGLSKDLANNCLALKKTGIMVNGITIVGLEVCVKDPKLGGSTCEQFGGAQKLATECTTLKGTVIYSMLGADNKPTGSVCCKLVV
ncbi:hypothetical protein J4217_02750 [Candidatus Pacearchaeota archaeon]|nr:hypothetical protein [Candidatus Pacearchaeota archaeon]